MPITLDHPDAVRPVDPQRFNVRGWAWFGAEQAQLAAIEAWSGGVLLGQAEALTLRPDVTAALGLPAETPTGFDFYTDRPISSSDGEFDLQVRLRRRDGTRSEPLLSRRGKIAARPVWPRPEAAAVAGGTPSDSPPPDHLQVRQVAGVWGPKFYAEGRVILDQILAAFREADRPLEEAASILDFGCGCGRVLWNWQHVPHRGEIWGCDIDGEAIAWDQANLGHIGRFCTNPALPPTSFRDGQFDAIYSVSVFTHLPEELQFAWLTELRRILRPGGILVASLHGQHVWSRSDPSVQAEVADRGFAYRKGGYTEGLPDFYMTTFHSEAYIRNRWSWFFEFVALKERHIHGLQDAAILRRRDD